MMQPARYTISPPPQEQQQPRFTVSPPPEQTRGRNLGQTYAGFVNQIIESAGRFTPFNNMADALPRSVNMSDELTGLAAEGAVNLRNMVHGENNDAGAANAGAREVERQQVAQYRQERPVQSFAEEMGSQLGASVLTGGTSLGQAGARFAAQKPVTAGAAFGGLEGAVSGAGAGEGARDRLNQAMVGLSIGAPLGALTAGAGDNIARRFGAGRPEMPEISDLQAAKTAAYQRVDEMGARYSSESVDSLVDRIRQRANQMSLNSTRHPAAASMIDSLDELASGRNMSLTELDQLRQIIRRDVANSTDRAEQEFGRMMIDEVDDFISNANASSMIAGSADDAADAIEAARLANSRFRKAELIDEAINRAELRASTGGTGGNSENAVRQNLRRLVEPGSRYRRFFSPEEQQAILRVVEGDNIQNLLRMGANFAPSKGGLSAMLGVGGTVAFPQVAVPSMVVGEVSRAAGASRRQALLDAMQQLIRTGQATRTTTGPAPALVGALSGNAAASRITAEEENRRRSMGPR